MSWERQDDDPAADCYATGHVPVRVVEEWPALEGVEWACEQCGRALDWDDVKDLMGDDDE